MLFSFLKYLQPTHYFQLFTKSGHSVYPYVEALPENIKVKLGVDTDYSSKTAQQYDLSWRAVHSGYIGSAKTYTDIDRLPLVDEYRFIKKYFHPVWSVYVLLLRLCSFKNPIAELKAWVCTRSVKRVSFYNTPVSYSEWDSYKSTLLSSQPKVSVVIPTLNRYSELKSVLSDLEVQDYKNFEVIVIDQSDTFSPDFYNSFSLNINLIRQEEKALWLARNTAIKNATGTLIALSEDDVRIGSDWISQHIKALDFFQAEVSAGVFYPEGQQIPISRSFFAQATQFATGNAMLFRNVFEKTGLFDRQFEKQRMGDGEFGMRLYLLGIKSISNPYATCVDVKAPTGGLREMGSWDAFRPSSFFAPRPIPSVLYYYRKYFGNKAAKRALLRTIPSSIIPYQFKRNKIMLTLSVIISIFLLPLLLYQVIKSWRFSSKKLKEGALIEELKINR